MIMKEGLCMNMIKHVLIVVIVEIIITTGMYWLNNWRFSRVLLSSLDEFFYGGVGFDCMLKVCILSGIVIGVLTI